MLNAYWEEIKMKSLFVDQEKCTGCRRCELACSFFHFQTYSLGRTRLHVVRDGEVEGPVVCVQCGLCQYACPIKGAIIRNKKTGSFLVTTKCNPKECNTECVNACPYGVIHVDLKLKRAIKCDFCGGSPSCVDACPWNVIHYVDAGSPYALNNKRVAEVRRRWNVERAYTKGSVETLKKV
jgi:Fe-S-cluster-containing hydrogenase component 2